MGLHGIELECEWLYKEEDYEQHRFVSIEVARAVSANRGSTVSSWLPIRLVRPREFSMQET